MAKLTFIEDSGETHTVDAEIGQSVMQVAIGNAIPGIIADCGGSGSCATCQVYVDPAWQGHIAPPAKTEQEMIECALYPQENSRLSCQIPVTPALDGLVVRLPKSQL